MFFKTIKSYPFLVWAAAIAIAPVAIIIEKHGRGEAEQLGFLPATYVTLILYGMLLGIIPFLIYFFSYRRMMKSSLTTTAIKIYSILIGVIAINALFFAMGRTTFYTKYFSLAVYYSVALVFTGIVFKLEKEK
jgi:hypothetical protein